MFKIYKFLFFTTLLIVPSSHYSWSAITCARKEYTIVNLPPMKLSLRNSHHNTSVVDSGYCETHILDLILLF